MQLHQQVYLEKLEELKMVASFSKIQVRANEASMTLSYGT